jgi:hypothetical protein
LDLKSYRRNQAKLTTIARATHGDRRYIPYHNYIIPPTQGYNCIDNHSGGHSSQDHHRRRRRPAIQFHPRKKSKESVEKDEKMSFVVPRRLFWCANHLHDYRSSWLWSYWWRCVEILDNGPEQRRHANTLASSQWRLQHQNNNNNGTAPATQRAERRIVRRMHSSTSIAGNSNSTSSSTTSGMNNQEGVRAPTAAAAVVELATAAAKTASPSTLPWRSFVHRGQYTNRQLERTDIIVKLYQNGGRRKEIVDLFRAEQDDYGSTDLSTTLSRLVKLIPTPTTQSNHRPAAVDDDALDDKDDEDPQQPQQTQKQHVPVRATADLREIINAIGDYLDDCAAIDVRHYANICHSIGKLRAVTDDTFYDSYYHNAARRIVDHLTDPVLAKDFLDRANPQCLSNLSWSLARLGRTDLFNNLLGQMTNRCQTALFGSELPQPIANMAWACATLNIKWPELFATIERRSHWLVTSGDGQHVANITWACAKLDYPSPALFKAVEDRSEWLVAKRHDPQGIVSTAWACATLGHQSPQLFAALEERSKWLVARSRPQGIANAAWACATLGHKCPRLFAAIDRRAEWLVDYGEPQHIANTVWASAKLRHQCPSLFAAMDRRADWLVETGDPQHVLTAVSACAKLGHKCPSLFAAIDRRAAWLVEKGDRQHVMTTLAASVKLGHQCPSLAKAVAAAHGAAGMGARPKNARNGASSRQPPAGGHVDKSSSLGSSPGRKPTPVPSKLNPKALKSALRKS